MNARTGYSQFLGSVTIAGYHSANIEGRDSPTPDNAFDPSLDLIYTWDISTPTHIKFEATSNPNLFQTLPSRSFIKSFFSATGSFYLSDVENSATSPALRSLNMPPPGKVHFEPLKQSLPADSTKSVVTIKRPLDIPNIASIKLAALSELLDSFDIDKNGLRSDSLDDASDLKDSISESLLALSDILASQVFTESIEDVVRSELANQKKIFLQVPMESTHKLEINSGFDSITALLKGGKAESDILPVPKGSDTNNFSSPPLLPEQMGGGNTHTLVQLQSAEKDNAESSTKNAPLITLINSETPFNELGSSDIALTEDLLPMTKKSTATLLSLPFSIELQNNQGIYNIYSYSEFVFKPRCDYYFSDKAALGMTYSLSITKFPYDTVYAGSENKVRFDSRIELAPRFAFIGEAGFAAKKYYHPLQYYITVKNKPTPVITSANFSHLFFGGGFILFPSDRFCLGITTSLTRSSSLRPYLIDSVLTARSRIGGSQNDDEYTYELTKGAVFSLWRIFWDINFSLDIAYENRDYASLQVTRISTKFNPNPAPINIKRSDYGPIFGFTLSKEFLFNSSVIGLFNSCTPSFDLQSANYTSTVKFYNYKDVTTTLSFEFGF